MTDEPVDIDHQDHARARYGVTLVLTLALVIWLMAGSESNSTLFLLVLLALGIGVIASVLWMTRLHSRRPLEVGIGAAVLAGATATVGILDERGLEFAALLTVLFVALGVPIIVVRGLLRRGHVDVQMVLGVLTIYLLFGIASAMALGIVDALESVPTLDDGTGNVTATYRDRTYFAYTTLTTTGYGDITPATDAARAVAMMTALIGQLYLVTAVAASVSLVASRPKHRIGD